MFDRFESYLKEKSHNNKFVLIITERYIYRNERCAWNDLLPYRQFSTGVTHQKSSFLRYP